jgi:hypothetical protein
VLPLPKPFPSRKRSILIFRAMSSACSLRSAPNFECANPVSSSLTVMTNGYSTPFSLSPRIFTSDCPGRATTISSAATPPSTTQSGCNINRYSLWPFGLLMVVFHAKPSFPYFHATRWLNHVSVAEDSGLQRTRMARRASSTRYSNLHCNLDPFYRDEIGGSLSHQSHHAKPILED